MFPAPAVPVAVTVPPLMRTFVFPATNSFPPMPDAAKLVPLVSVNELPAFAVTFPAEIATSIAATQFCDEPIPAAAFPPVAFTFVVSPLIVTFVTANTAGLLPAPIPAPNSKLLASIVPPVIFIFVIAAVALFPPPIPAPFVPPTAVTFAVSFINIFMLPLFEPLPIPAPLSPPVAVIIGVPAIVTAPPSLPFPPPIPAPFMPPFASILPFVISMVPAVMPFSALPIPAPPAPPVAFIRFVVVAVIVIVLALPIPALPTAPCAVILGLPVIVILGAVPVDPPIPAPLSSVLVPVATAVISPPDIVISPIVD